MEGQKEARANSKSHAKTKFALWLEQSKISNIVLASNSFLIIIWSIAFLGCFVYCFYLVVTCILNFYKYETTVSISYITETPTNFPAVTICNLNPFDENRALPFLQETMKRNSCVILTNITHSMECTNKSTPYSFFNYVLTTVKRELANSNFTAEQLSNYGYRWNETVTSKAFCHASLLPLFPKSDFFPRLHFQWHGLQRKCFRKVLAQ